MTTAVPSRRERRAEAPRPRHGDPGGPSMDAPSIGPSSGSGPSMDDLEDVSAGIGHARQIGTTATHEGRARLLAMPVRRAHPILVFLQERGVGIGEGAALLGVGERTLRSWMTWSSRPTDHRASDIAVDLGMRPADLFPPID